MICPNCNSKLGYIRLNKQEWICRNCGQRTEIKTAKKMLRNFAGLEKN